MKLTTLIKTTHLIHGVGFWHFHVKKQKEGFAKKKLRVKDN
jgi:hypothetical protein